MDILYVVYLYVTDIPRYIRHTPNTKLLKIIYYTIEKNNFDHGIKRLDKLSNYLRVEARNKS